jgi:glycosyltransferase involved in cell wall biosynthesis
MTPKISVVMGVFNGESYLDAAISSIAEQTFTDFEFIIIDDGSTDSTATILEQWAAKDPRLQIITNKKNLGLTRSLNIGTAQASGEWIARQDGDDRSMPTRFARQMEFLQQNPTVELLGTGCWIIDEQGRRQPEARFVPDSHIMITWYMLTQNPFFHSSIICKRQLITENPYDETITFAQDYELWGRLLKKCRGANLPEPLIESRRHPQSTSTTQFNQQQQNSFLTIESQLYDLIPGHKWSAKSLLPLRNIVENPWPDPKETSQDWSLLLKIFQAFKHKHQQDKTQLASLQQQLMERLALSLTSRAGATLNRELFFTVWHSLGIQFFTVLSKTLFLRCIRYFQKG